MKRLLLFFAVVAGMTAVTVGCRGVVDNLCSWDYIVINQSDYNVSIVRNGEAGEVIVFSEEQLLYNTSGHCRVGNVPPIDLYQENEIMRVAVSVQIQVAGELMPDIIFRRKYWDFTTIGNSLSIYTLTITNELIETIKKE